LTAVKVPEISELLREKVVGARVAPAAVAGYIGASRSDRSPHLGSAGTLPGGVPVASSSLFDLASVSKPVVACTAARLVAGGTIDLAQPLGSLLPEARGTASEQVSLELLLAHRAGLEAHRPYFAPVLAGQPVRAEQVLRSAAQTRRPECTGPAPEAGFPPLYSDLGYLLVGAALEAATATPLDALVAQQVSVPLGLELGSARQLYAARASFARDVVPTEVTIARGGALRGVVHDDNAWALSGHGTSGHAGLFGTVEAVLGFGAELLSALEGRSAWLDQSVLWNLVKPRPGGTLRAGFDGKSEGASSAGSLAGPRTFGHLGFTGTSLWCDPGAGIATVLLTNRVCPTRDNPRIRAARPQVHDALFAMAGGRDVLPGPPNP
jgi:CubicO group peptidase (beta-lactamase class C family)